MEIAALIFSIFSVVIGAAGLVIEIIKLVKANKKRINRQDANQDG